MPKKKPFIDKTKAVTFHLVHRSQKDPLQASEDASQHVLVPGLDQKELKKEEERSFGVFYEDDYDYTQHLKDVSDLYDVEPLEENFAIAAKGPTAIKGSKGPASIQLPSSVFGSKVETETGLLNKAAPLVGPQVDWDPDIVAALDGALDYDDPDNEMEDDFFVQANTGALGGENDGDADSVEGDIGSDEAEFSDDGEQTFSDEETKSRFTSYSMSSSVIKRNEGLTLLDDRFEKIYEQYDEDEIGPLDHEDIEGRVQQNSEVLNMVMQEFEKTQNLIKMKDAVQPATGVGVNSDSESEDEDLIKMVVEEPKEKWDCESIISTYSNLYNHPKTIEEPSKSKKHIHLTSKLGIPEGVLPDRGPTRKQLEKEELEETRISLATTFRPRDETADEKRERKQGVKEERKFRRQEKKANKTAFKKENQRQDKEILNLQNNLGGVRIL